MSSGFLLNRFRRSVDRPDQFARSKFINGVDKEGFIDLAYNSKHSGVMDDITVEDARWLARLLGQLSDRQINDAFRAANYSVSERRILVNTLRGRIRELQMVGSRNLEATR
jgi:ribonuclease I